jgi:hypothetical protein
MKQNCWEFKKCGNEQNCPAFSEERLDGINGGKNSGRCCWVVAGTLSLDKPTGKFAQEIDTCEKCDFYLHVKKEEGPLFL